jgi:hypothetical protein
VVLALEPEAARRRIEPAWDLRLAQPGVSPPTESWRFLHFSSKIASLLLN